ncbi:mycofactocin system transcriptional regulator [Rhodococcus sp. NPDC060090]|uniref:mycofactocin system transcriptional regulator n=1 Tax=Rhodococcus sp. NPDC060090 TaxID=3347056 RepID=UPI003665A311
MRSRRKPSARVGRRPSTTKEGLSAIGIELFQKAGFDETSVDDIAEEAGIARRTFFRYFPSKNALAWGDFDAHLDHMRDLLAAIPDDVPLAEALTTAILDFNTFPDSEADRHRARMGLILRTPALQGYSSVMYDGWRRVVAEFTARRTGESPDDHMPRTHGYLLLGVALAAYEEWLDNPTADLRELLDTGMQPLTAGLDYSSPAIADPTVAPHSTEVGLP